MTTTRARSSVLALAAGAMLAAGMAACGDGDGDATAGTAQPEGPAESTEASTEIVGGSTLLRLNPTLERGLDLAGIEVEPTGSAKAVAGGVRFPIAAGAVDIDTLSGRIQHEGGLRFSAAGQSVKATNLVVRPGKGVVTADVAGRRVDLLAADFGRPKVPQTGDVVVLPAAAELAGDAIGDRLGTDVLDGGVRLGRLTVNAQRP